MIETVESQTTKTMTDRPPETTRSFLRWAGSKKQLLPELRKRWVTGQRYVEPFAGSACLFFDLKPKSALLGDMNEDLIDTYLGVKYQVRHVIRALDGLEKGRDVYADLRKMDSTNLSRPERAARFIYLNRFCFNGLYRTNKTGMFNVPYGGDKAGSLPSAALLRACSRLLSRAKLRAWDFEDTLRQVGQADFVYMDPPFHVGERRTFREYTAKGFSNDKLARVRYWLERLEDMKVPFLVSYAESKEAELLKDGFFSKSVTVTRNIAGFSTNRGKATELLISNMSFEKSEDKRHARN